jgi:hypothetical protein
MPKFEHIIYRVKVSWDGMGYRFQPMVGNDWSLTDPGSEGWEFVAFVPNHEAFISDSFKDYELAFIRLAVFKRQTDS